MAKRNLTKEIAKRVKQTADPIMEELLEQFEQTQFHKSMAKFREIAEQQFANKSLTISK
jgi:hypothetical protein